MNVNIALLTVTDTRTLKTDKSGNILLKKIKKAKHNLIDRKICKDSKKDIKKILKTWLKKKKIDVIITTGGTGLTGRDITPEAINEIADKKIPGFGEVFRYMESAAKNKYPLAQHARGFMYFEGECTEKDINKSIEWFTKSAEQGLLGSATTLAMIYEEGKLVPQDLEKAQHWYKKAGIDKN